MIGMEILEASQHWSGGLQNRLDFYTTFENLKLQFYIVLYMRLIEMHIKPWVIWVFFFNASENNIITKQGITYMSSSCYVIHKVC